MIMCIVSKQEAINILENIIEQVKSDEWMLGNFRSELDNEVSLATNHEVEKKYQIELQLLRKP